MWSGSERRLKKAGVRGCVCSLSHNQLHSVASLFCGYKARAPFHKLKEETIFFFFKFIGGAGPLFLHVRVPVRAQYQKMCFSLPQKCSATFPEKPWKSRWQGDRIKRLGELSPDLAYKKAELTDVSKQKAVFWSQQSPSSQMRDQEGAEKVLSGTSKKFLYPSRRNVPPFKVLHRPSQTS